MDHAVALGAGLSKGIVMKRTGIRTRFRTDGVPEDLLVFQARMADHGINVRLPNARSDFRLADPIRIEGEPLSNTVIRLRDAEP